MKFSNHSINGIIYKYPGIRADRLAETSTLQPESVDELSYNLRTAQEAIILLFLCSWYYPWRTEKIHRMISNRCYHEKYQGEWSEVQRLLEAPIDNPQDFYDFYIKKHSPEEFYGNILRRAQGIEKLWKIKKAERDLFYREKKPKKVNTRDYKDKGSRRPSHEYHGIPNYPDEIESDRRSLLYHPLLREAWEANIFSLEWEDAASRILERRSGFP